MGQVDRASNIYSLGIVLWELFTVTSTKLERVVGINKLRYQDQVSVKTLIGQ